MRCRQFSFAAVSFVFFVSIPVDAQTSAATITSSTEVVLIPTVVNDKSGSYLSGLKKEDFVLKQDGKSQPIAIFEEIKTNPVRLQRLEGARGTFSNFDPEPGNGRIIGYRRLSIIVLDFVNTPFADQASARQALLKFLSEVAESGEPMCLLTLNPGGLTLVRDFTDDPKLLAEALRRMKSGAPEMVSEPIVSADHPPPTDLMSETITQQIRDQLESESRLNSLETKNRALITIEALQQIAKGFRGFPGRKALIWTSSGFPFSLSSSSAHLCEPACPVQERGEVQPAYEKLWKMMNDAQIAIYSVDLRSAAGGDLFSTGGVRPSDIGDPQFDTDAQAQEKMADTNSTLQLFAENTGGKAFLGGSNLVQSFRQAVQDDSSYYVLGYYVSAKSTKAGWHDVSVAIHPKGAHLRFRNGFFLSRDASVPTAKQDIQLALDSPLDFTGVPISVTWSDKEPGKGSGKAKIPFELVMPANFASVDESDQNHMVVDIAAVAKDSDGNVSASLSQRIDVHLKADGMEQIEHNGLTYRNALQLPPGKHTVRFVVRDSLGNRMGSVAAPVTVSP